MSDALSLLSKLAGGAPTSRIQLTSSAAEVPKRRRTGDAPQSSAFSPTKGLSRLFAARTGEPRPSIARSSSAAALSALAQDSSAAQVRNSNSNSNSNLASVSAVRSKARVVRTSAFPTDGTVKTLLVLSSDDARLLDLWPSDDEAASMAAGLCQLAAPMPRDSVSDRALFAASLYFHAVQFSELAALTALETKSSDAASVELAAQSLWKTSVSSAFELLRLHALRGAGAMQWFHFLHEKLCVAFKCDSETHAVVAVVSRSRPGLRSVLRSAGIVYAMPCAPSVDVAERKSEIVRQQLLLMSGLPPSSDAAANDTETAHIERVKEAIHLQSLSLAGNVGGLDVSSQLAPSVRDLSTALVVDGVDAVARLAQFLAELPRDESACIRAPAPFLHSSLRHSAVERCGAVQFAAANQSPRRSPRRARDALVLSSPPLEMSSAVTATPPRSPNVKQRYRLAIRGPLSGATVSTVLALAAKRVTSFSAQMTLDNRTGGFNAALTADDVAQHAHVRNVAVSSERQWRVSLEDAAAVEDAQ
jgi:hypothetical protein